MDHRRHGVPEEGQALGVVAWQYCGMLGTQDNFHVAMSMSLACEQGSVPLAWQQDLHEDWAEDPVRRQRTGVPEDLRFATKWTASANDTLAKVPRVKAALAAATG